MRSLILGHNQKYYHDYLFYACLKSAKTVKHMATPFSKIPVTNVLIGAAMAGNRPQ